MPERGLALVAVAMVWVGLAWWFRRDEMPEHRAPFVLWMVASAILAGLALSGGSGWPVILVSGLSLVGAGFGLFAVLTRGLHGVAALEQGVRVGDAAPDFCALDESGESVEGSSFRGERLLLKFFRGHW